MSKFRRESLKVLEKCKFNVFCLNDVSGDELQSGVVVPLQVPVSVVLVLVEDSALVLAAGWRICPAFVPIQF